MHPKTAEMAFALASDRIDEGYGEDVLRPYAHLIMRAIIDTQDEYLIAMAEQRPEVLFCASREVWLEALRSPHESVSDLAIHLVEAKMSVGGCTYGWHPIQ